MKQDNPTSSVKTQRFLPPWPAELGKPVKRYCKIRVIN